MSKSQLTVRHMENTDGTVALDEVIAHHADVHIEHMGDSWAVLIDTEDGQHINLALRSKGGVIVEQR